jgi:hypothetical protein
MGEVPQLGGKNSQFQHNRTSNMEGGMKILQDEITGTQTSFSTNFGSKPSFLPPQSFFLSASTAAPYIFTAPSYTTTIITLELCAKNAEFQQFILRFNKISLLCKYHRERG